jgi:hypothetical protein
MTIDYEVLPGELAAPLVIQDFLRKDWEAYSWDDSSGRFSRKILAAYGASDTEEADAYAGFKAFYEAVASEIATRWSSHRDQLQSSEKGFFAILERDLTASDAKEAGGAIEYEHEDTDGQVDIKTKTGLWPALADDMVANKRHFLASAITIGSLEAKSTNRGSLTKVAATAFQHILRGKASGALILTVDDDNVGAPKLNVQVQLDTPLPDGKKLFDGGTWKLQPEKTYQNGDVGADVFQFDRPGLTAPTKTGDSTNILSGAVFSDPAEGDMPGGVVSYRILHQGGSTPWLVELYSDQERKASQRVGSKAFAGVTGIESLIIPLRNKTELAIDFDIDLALAVGGIPNEDDEKVGTFDVLTPQEGDRWTMAIASDQAGKFGTKLASIGPISLPVGPAKPGSACTAALAGAGAGNVDNGTHTWKYTYVSALGESEGATASNVLNVVDKTINGKVDLTGIANGPAGTTAKKIYRRIAGDMGKWKLVGTINDNTTTTFQDNIADSGLGADVPIQFDESLAADITV